MTNRERQTQILLARAINALQFEISLDDKLKHIDLINAGNEQLRAYRGEIRGDIENTVTRSRKAPNHSLTLSKY